MRCTPGQVYERVRGLVMVRWKGTMVRHVCLILKLCFTYLNWAQNQTVDLNIVLKKKIFIVRYSIAYQSCYENDKTNLLYNKTIFL